MAAGFSHSFDRSVSDGLSGAHGLDATFEPGKTIGGARLQLLGAVSTLAVGELARSNTTARIGADLVKAQILTQAVTAGLKMSVRRTRPDGTQFSFPSGHTSTTFATAAVLQRHLGWKAGVPAYALAAYVATSRIQEKRHFLSDVTFGAAIGIVVGRAVGVGRDEARFAIAPLTAPGGGGVAFTWIGR
jgi:membrane-associated phospholipid phosphatase